MLHKFAVLFALLILLGCNQSDSNSNSPSSDKTKTDTQSNMNEDASVAEAEPEREGKVIARVNGRPIYDDDSHGRNREYLISEEIIFQEGIRQGLDKKYRNQVRDFERALIIRGTKESILENAEPTKQVSDEEIQSYYEQNKDKYSHFRVYEISFPDSNLGNEIIEKAKAEEDLQNIANSHPDMVINVNDIGYNRDLVRHFQTNEVGAVSEVIQKADGTFSVLKIVEVRETPLIKSKNTIKNILEARRKAGMFDSYTRKVAEENNMTIEIIK